MTTRHRILIVEDEWIVAEDYASIFRDAGYEVVGPVSTVQEAMGLIGRMAIAVALLDIGLTEDDSYPVALRLEEIGVPYVFLSGYLNRDLPPQLRHHQVMSKPASPREILAAVGRALEGAGLPHTAA